MADQNPDDGPDQQPEPIGNEDEPLNPAGDDPAADLPVFTYEQALNETIGRNEKGGRTFRGSIFQLTITFVALMALNSSNFIILGLPFMKSEPQHFRCRDADTDEWRSCTKAQICQNGLVREEYEPEREDYEYIDNWQSQVDMLCEPKSRIGFLGACFFIGVLVGSTVIPFGFLSDIIGRKWIFVGTLVLLIVACTGFIFARSLEELYVYMFLYGITFPGRLIVGINYAYEFNTLDWQELIQPWNQYTQGLTLILTAFYFQVISKSVTYLEIAHLIFVCYLLIQTLYLFPESPRFNYSKDRFEIAKTSLKSVAKTNGVEKLEKMQYKFDTEKDLEDAKTEIDMENRIDGGNLYGLSNSTFVKNVVLMSVLFTCFSFCFWLSDFQVEYLGTDMYMIFYANGIVCIISGQINQQLYPRLGMKLLIITVQCISIVAAGYICLVQTKVFSFEDQEQEKLFVDISIPVALVLLSCTIQVGFTAVVQSAYQDERVFPFSKKATAINIIILVSKTATITAPFVNELDEPIPIYVILAVCLLSILLVLFFPSKAELDKLEKVKSQEQRKMTENGSNKGNEV